jgi:ubiquinone/menaquinone biosynthesis C-methylase UbiE
VHNSGKEPSPPPYFDGLFRRLAAGDPESRTAFGRHVHWGYWEDPQQADGSAEDYARAAEALCWQVLQAAGAHDGLRILDVGCGFGGTIASLNERFSSLDLVGVNIDPRQLERARQLVRSGNDNRIRFVEADACELPFPAQSFDVVLAIECIFHFPSRVAFLKEASHVLAAGGLLAISDFIPASQHLNALKQYGTGMDEATRQSYGSVDILCPIEQYQQLAASAGLHLTQSKIITAHTLPTYQFLRKHHRQSSASPDSRNFDKATSRLLLASQMGWIDYCILQFSKRSAVEAAAA